MDFDVTARQHGNTVRFQVEADDVKDALGKALVEADKIFDYHTGDDHAKVSVKMSKHQDE